MQIKIHEAYRTIVSLCDTDLIGKTFSQDIKQIYIRPTFFQGEEVDKKQAIILLKDFDKEDATFTIVGKESVECAIEARIISNQGIIMIDNVPVALGLM